MTYARVDKGALWGNQGQDESQRRIVRLERENEQLRQALRDVRDGRDNPCAIIERALA